MTFEYRVNPPVSNGALNELYAASWPSHVAADFEALRRHYLAYVCAYDGFRLAGYVYLAWDGWQHAFLLEPTVHPAYRRRGVGVELVYRAAAAAKEQGCSWLHVDFTPELAPFYERCGFRPTSAGLMRLDE